MSMALAAIRGSFINLSVRLVTTYRKSHPLVMFPDYQ